MSLYKCFADNRRPLTCLHYNSTGRLNIYCTAINSSITVWSQCSVTFYDCMSSSLALFYKEDTTTLATNSKQLTGLIFTFFIHLPGCPRILAPVCDTKVCEHIVQTVCGNVARFSPCSGGQRWTDQIWGQTPGVIGQGCDETKCGKKSLVKMHFSAAKAHRGRRTAIQDHLHVL